MNPYEKIKELTKQNGISVRELEKRLGYSNGYFSKWKKVSPNSDGLAKVADYFNVSTDYLLGRTDDLNFITKSSEEPGSDLMGYFRLNTAGFDPDETEQIEESLKEYTDFLVQKARERKARDKK